MSDPYIGEIRMFAGNYAPQQWAFCDGQLVNISGNEALYSLLSTSYGGDGRTNFALPDMRGRIPVHKGTGPGLNNKSIGQRYGVEKVMLNTSEIPSHTHALQVSSEPATLSDPTNAVLAAQPDDLLYVAKSDADTLQTMNSGTIANAGAGLGHNNMMPYLGLSFIIAMQGIYPNRN